MTVRRALELVIAMRGSSCESVLIVGTGAPGGERGPCENVGWVNASKLLNVTQTQKRRDALMARSFDKVEPLSYPDVAQSGTNRLYCKKIRARATTPS